MTTAEAIQGLTVAVKLLAAQIVELRGDIKEIRERQDKAVPIQGGWEWAKTHPWPAAFIFLALLLALSGQLSLLPSVLGASIHALPTNE
jgi:hypothetical protein